MERKTLYERIGGSSVVHRVCAELYRRIDDDERLSAFFAGLDIQSLVHRQERFFSCLLDDRKSNLVQLRKAHQPLVNKRITDFSN